jgi:aminopeptidase YwaD
VAAAVVMFPASASLRGQSASLLPDRTISALAQELSGETAKRNLEYVAREHRVRGSRGWHRAGQYIVDQLTTYGITDARIERFPADGKIFYGTQRSRPPWDADFAELWELRHDSTGWVPAARLADWDAMPISLAEDSENGDVTANLVDVGDGTAEGDYAGKEIRGKLVLAAQQAGAVQRLAVDRFGAAGIVSYAQNQRTAWWGEDENLVRWGHLESFPTKPTFAFMVSLKVARALRQRLARGEEIRMHATVRAGQHAGALEVVTATIPGGDPRLRNEEIVYSCHLDHQRPGANDNASGCVTILEVARTLSKLIADGRLTRPARTIRFVWPPEVEGTLALLNGRPELPPRMRAAIHMDMVGGGEVTKSIFHVTRGPASLPSFVYDIGAAFGDLVNRQSDAFAGTGSATWPLVAPEGGKEALRAEFVEMTMGSDHDVYNEGSYRIPSIYLNDWPDRYIHTNFDTPANIDPTKLKRAAFIGAASGYFLANLGTVPGDVEAAWRAAQAAGLRRTATMLQRRAALPDEDAAALTRAHFAYERAVFASLERFAAIPPALRRAADSYWKGVEGLDVDSGNGFGPRPAQGSRRGIAAAGDSAGRIVFRRDSTVRGPMSVFGYDYLRGHLGEAKADAIRLPNFTGLRGSGDEYAYEVLNFVDGKRSAREIRDVVSAEFGPVPLDVVVEYLRALETAGVVRRGGGGG